MIELLGGGERRAFARGQGQVTGGVSLGVHPVLAHFCIPLSASSSP
jgi:hypothetical protein